MDEATETARHPKVTYLGHACVVLEASGGERCVVDPYAPGALGGAFALPPIDLRANYVVTTHDHEDHAAFGAIDGHPTRIQSGKAGPFTVRRWPAWHDEYGGRRFGGAVDVVTIDVGGLRLLHLSDVGHAPPADRPDAWLKADVCCLPVGGCYTIGPEQAVRWWQQLRPKRTIPVHYADDDVDLPLQPVGRFLTRCPGTVVSSATERSSLEMKRNDGAVWGIYPLRRVTG